MGESITMFDALSETVDQLIFRVIDNEVNRAKAMKLQEKLHSKLIGNEDYINCNIILTDTDTITGVNPMEEPTPKGSFDIILCLAKNIDWNKVPADFFDTIREVLSEDQNK